MDASAEALPMLTVASRAERATLRAARWMAAREAGPTHRAHLESNADGLAVTPSEVQRLVTCHRYPSARFDWAPIAAKTPSPLPERTHELEKAARKRLMTYEPNWQERVFGEEAQQRRALAELVPKAAKADEEAFQKALRETEAQNADILLARRLFELDPEAIHEALTLHSGLMELGETLYDVAILPPGGGRLIAVAGVLHPEDAPQEQMTSETVSRARREPIPDAERRRIHLAAVCSTALRVGAEFLAALPIDSVDVVAEVDAHPAPAPILQVRVTSRAVADPAWKGADASGLARRLGARMDWTPERGFAPIAPVLLGSTGRPLAQTA